jgi:hypothetical protein
LSAVIERITKDTSEQPAADDWQMPDFPAFRLPAAVWQWRRLKFQWAVSRKESQARARSRQTNKLSSCSIPFASSFAPLRELFSFFLNRTTARHFIFLQGNELSSNLKMVDLPSGDLPTSSGQHPQPALQFSAS